MADAITPFLGLIKPIVGDEAGEDLWGDKLNDNFDKLDDSHEDLSTAIADLETGKLADAPSDGQQYARQNAEWTAIIPGIDGAVSLGLGEPVYLDLVGGVLSFASLRGTGSVVLSSSADEVQINGRPTTWTEIPDVPSSFPPAAHTHNWAEITGKPSVYPPAGHSHSIAEVTNLQATLDNKANVVHTHLWADITDKPVTFPPATHVHVIADVGGLQTALDGKVADTGDTMTGPLVLPSTGTISATSLNFGTAGTGLYGAASSLNFAVGGQNRLSIATTSVSASVPIRGNSTGTAAVPSISWAPDPDTGFYSIADNQLGFSVGGTLRITFNTTDLLSTVPITLPADPTLALHATTKQYTDTKDALKEDKVLKGAANGYCPLDSSVKVPSSYLPAYVDDVLEFANLAAFPVTGSTGVLYIALDTNKTYRWSGTVYTEISPSPGSTDAVPEGSVNKYYTDERVDDRAAALIKNGTGITWAYDDTNATLTPTVTLVGVTDGDKGDIVVSGSGTSWMLDAAVQTANDARYVNVTGDTLTGPLAVPNGTAANTSLNFGTANTGFYGSATGIIQSIGGAARASLTATEFVTTVPIRVPSGVSSSAGVNFGTNGYGVFGSGSNVQLVTAGVARLTAAVADITATLPITLPADPTTALQAATKQYADTKLSEAPNDGKTYGRTSLAWTEIFARVAIATAAPATGAHGEMWWDSDSGNLHVRYNDGDSTAWIATGSGPMGLTGPQGPQGPQGIQGIEGPVGGAADYVNVTGDTMSGDLLPNANGTLNLGSNSFRWATVYTSDLSLSNGIGDWTIVEGEDDLFITNNKSGKRYKFALIEVA